jgi:diacylglycerol kinase family enzyme
VTVLVQNGEQYTYFKNRPIFMAEGAHLDSGTLSGIVLQHTTPTIMPTVIWRAFSHRARMVRHGAVTGFEQVAGLTARSRDDRAIHLQVDGDYIGEVTEARFSVAPKALTVVG